MRTKLIPRQSRDASSDEKGARDTHPSQRQNSRSELVKTLPSWPRRDDGRSYQGQWREFGDLCLGLPQQLREIRHGRGPHLMTIV